MMKENEHNYNRNKNSEQRRNESLRKRFKICVNKKEKNGVGYCEHHKNFHSKYRCNIAQKQEQLRERFRNHQKVLKRFNNSSVHSSNFKIQISSSKVYDVNSEYYNLQYMNNYNDISERDVSATFGETTCSDEPAVADNQGCIYNNMDENSRRKCLIQNLGIERRLEKNENSLWNNYIDNLRKKYDYRPNNNILILDRNEMYYATVQSYENAKLFLSNCKCKPIVDSSNLFQKELFAQKEQNTSMGKTKVDESTITRNHLNSVINSFKNKNTQSSLQNVEMNAVKQLKVPVQKNIMLQTESYWDDISKKINKRCPINVPFKSVSSVESKMDYLMGTSNNCVQEIRSYENAQDHNDVTKKKNKKMHDLGAKITVDKSVGVENETITKMHYFDKATPVFDMTVYGDKNKNIKSDLNEVIFNNTSNFNKQNTKSSVFFEFEISAHDCCTQVTASLSKACKADDRINVPTHFDKRNRNTAINTDPLGLIALLNISADFIKGLLSYMFGYESLPTLPQREYRYPNVQSNRKLTLTEHIINRPNVYSERHPPIFVTDRNGLSKCRFCGHSFARPHSCQMHNMPSDGRRGLR